MAMASFNTYQITQLDSNITALKSKADLLVDVSHLHEAHLHHLENKTDATKETAWRHSGSKYLVLIKNHQKSWKEIQIDCSPPQKHGQIRATSLTGTWCTSSQHSWWNSHPHTYEWQENATWGPSLITHRTFSRSRFPICTTHFQWSLHTSSTSPWSPIQISLIFPNFATANSFQLYCQHLHYSRCGPSQPPHHQTLKIISTYSSSDLHSCFHLRDIFFCKGRGDKFEKVMLRGTLPSKC